MVQLEKCCWTLSLQLGTKIIGYLQAVCALIVLIGLSVYSANIGDGGSTKIPTNQTEDHVPVAITIIGAVLAALQLLFSILLVIGATTAYGPYILPWIVFNVLYALLSGILCVISLAMTGGATSLLTLAIQEGITVYCILVVHSFYTEIKEGR